MQLREFGKNIAIRVYNLDAALGSKLIVQFAADELVRVELHKRTYVRSLASLDDQITWRLEESLDAIT